MSALFSPVIGVMLKAIRRSSRCLVRDFNEVRYLKSSYTAASEFTRSAYTRSSKMIAEGLEPYKRGLEVVFDGTRDKREPKGVYWFISPIDSRTNFMSGIPYFATAVALVKDGEVVAAVVDAPVLRETFCAEEGYGTFSESEQSRYTRMHVTKKERINATLIDYTAGCANIRSLIDDLASQHVVLRSMGSVVLGFSYLCAASYDMLVYSGVQGCKLGIGKLFVKGSKGSIVVKDDTMIASNFFLLDYVEKKFLQK